MIIPAIVLGVGLTMLLIENVARGRRWPTVAGWWPRAIALNAVQATAAYLAEFVYHWNVRTPHWLGYWIQRPESHCVHHQEGLHHYNYADLPIWDMLFGTFHNPRNWNGRCGFGPRGEHHLGEMLLGRIVDDAGSVGRGH